jgi:Protein of unknown function (DUF4240)
MDTNTEMTLDRFWEVIASTVSVNADGSIDASPLVDFLSTLPPPEIVAFARRCSQLYAESRTWQLWGAASLIHDGAPDDTFDYFRSWLIGRGREVYESAMRDPDTLADVASPEAIDDTVYAAGEIAYEAATQSEIPDYSTVWPDLDKGIDFEDSDVMAEQYPRLSEKFRD